MSPFVLRYRKTEGKSRFTIVVSAKIDKRATARNRMRRIIRESLRRMYPLGADILCIVKKNVAGSSQKEASELLEKSFHEKNHPNAY